MKPRPTAVALAVAGLAPLCANATIVILGYVCDSTGACYAVPEFAPPAQVDTPDAADSYQVSNFWGTQEGNPGTGFRSGWWTDPAGTAGNCPASGATSDIVDGQTTDPATLGAMSGFGPEVDPGLGGGDDSGSQWSEPTAPDAGFDPWFNPDYNAPAPDDSWSDPWTDPWFDDAGSDFSGDTGFDGSSGSDGWAGDPISVRDGSMAHRETDYAARGLAPVSFSRRYNSHPALARVFSVMPMGHNWRSGYDRAVQAAADGHAYLIRSTGASYAFTRQADGSWAAPRHLPMQLVQTADGGWQLTTPRADVETYNALGQLVKLSSRNGVSQTLSYDANGRVSQVTDPSGRWLSFAYNDSGLLQSVVTSAGATTAYGYNANASLASVTYPDGSVRAYLYENPGFPGALTGIVDEAGQRVASWTYDGQGRAVSNTVGNSLGSASVAYGDVQTVATMALGASKAFQLAGMPSALKQPTGVTASCSGCATLAAGRSYDSNGFLIGTTDANGVSTTLVRDAQGRLVSRTIADGTAQAQTTTFAWHPTFSIPTDVNVAGVATHFDYDAAGNMVRKTVTAGTLVRVWQRSYNANGQLLQQTGPKGETRSYRYDGLGRLSGITDELGKTLAIGSHDADGRITSVTDANGVVTTYRYDARGRLLSRTRGSETTGMTWYAYGRLASVTYPSGTSRSFGYDSAHRLVQVQDSSGSRTVFTLNAAGQRTRVDVYNADGTLARTQGIVRDAMGRVTQLTDGQGHVTTFQRDAVGQVVATVDPLGRTSRVQRDARGRPVQVTDPANGTTRFEYDVLGRPTAVTDPRSVRTTYAYDGMGSLLQIGSPDAGTTYNTFDVGGLLVNSRDALNHLTTYGYDAAYRLSSVTYADSSGATYTYDQGANGVGRLTGVTDPSGTTSFAYDGQGRVLSRQSTVAGRPLAVQYAYDASGRLAEMVYPSGARVDYAYGSDGRVQQLSVNGTVMISSVAYDGTGAVLAWHFANGQQVVRAFDLAGRPTQNALYGISSDDGDRITRLAPTALNAVQRTKQFAYDTLDRLTGMSDGRSPMSYSYDANGNRLSDSDGSTANSYAIDPNSNRVLSLTSSNGGKLSFGYDADGHVTSRGSTSLLYNTAGQLVSAGIPSYAYNAWGQRVRKSGLSFDDTAGDLYVNRSGVSTSDSKQRLYAYGAAGEMLGEYFGNGSRIEETVHFAGGPALVLKGSQVFFVIADHLGTPRQIADRQGRTVWYWETATFGSSTPVQSNPAITPQSSFSYNLRFPGQYYDAESGLLYNWHRYYDAQTGRYMQSDPIGLAGGPNAYGYADGNPVSIGDFRGLDNPAMGPYTSYGPRSGPIIDTSKLDPRTLLPLPGFEQPADSMPDISDETKRALACDLALGSPCKFVAIQTPGNILVKGAVYGACNLAVHFACEAILKPSPSAKMCMAPPSYPPSLPGFFYYP